MLQEDLGDLCFEIAKTEGEKERMVEKEDGGVIDYLQEEPWAPVVSVGVEFFEGALGEFGGAEAVDVRHSGLKVHLFCEDNRTVQELVRYSWL